MHLPAQPRVAQLAADQSQNMFDSVLQTPQPQAKSGRKKQNLGEYLVHGA